MLPYIDLYFIKLPSYTTMVLLGMLAFTVYAIIVLEKAEKVSFQTTNRLLIISAVGFVLLAASAFVFNSLFHSIAHGHLVIGGITWLGGVIGAFPAMLFMIYKFCPSVKGKALLHFNLLIPGIVLAHGFGRIGCFLGGCCFGAVTDSFLGISFPINSPAALAFPTEAGNSLPVLPTQLIEACFEFLLFIFMIICYKTLKKHFLETYLLAYGSFRFVMEFFRGDDRGSTGTAFSPSQWISLLLIMGGITLILYHKGIILKKLRERIDANIKKQLQEASPATALRELKGLLDEGIITQDEFDQKKAEILARY